MTVNTIMYGKAQIVAMMAMGRTDHPRKKDRHWVANDDPLAFHELTECIYNFYEQGRREEPRP